MKSSREILTDRSYLHICPVSHLAHVVGDGGGGHVADGELRLLVVDVGGDAAVDVAPQHHHLHHQLALVSTS